MGCFASFPKYIEEEWYPQALKRAREGYLGCKVCNPDGTFGSFDPLTETFRDYGMTAFDYRGAGHETDITKAYWIDATVGMGQKLFNIAKKIRDPLILELREKISKKDNGRKLGIDIELSKLYSIYLLQDVIKELNSHWKIRKIRLDNDLPYYYVSFTN